MCLAAAHSLIFVPLYNDPLVIVGQGTIGMEILKQLSAKHLNAIFGTVSGGGLIAGISEYVKHIGSPHTCIIGTEMFNEDVMACSLEEGKCVTLSEVGPFSDGTAVWIVGKEPF
jgi:threonine dehydratase